jgi:RND superfamily putative drug exporter
LSAITGRLAAICARRPWVVIGLWLLLLVVGGLFARNIGSVVNSSHALYFTPESMKGADLLEQRLRGPAQAKEVVIVQSPHKTVDDAGFQAFTTSVTDGIKALEKSDGSPLVASVLSFYETNAAALVSTDRHTTILPTTLNASAEEAGSSVRPLVDYVKGMNGREGFTVLTMGEGSIYNTFTDTAHTDGRRAETLGVPVALIVLVFVFGTAAAAGLPLLLALFSIVIAFGLTALIGHLVTMDTIVENIITMIGLAVGIDYSLLIVERFREERRRGVEKYEAVRVAGSTAAQAVVFSGGTVMVSLLALLMVPEKTFLSIALGAAVVVIAAVMAALTLLPALLGLVGDGVNRLAIRLPGQGYSQAEDSPFWARAAAIVMSRPLLAVCVAAVFLVVVATPFVGMRRGFSGVSMMPPSSDAHKAFTILNSEFSAGLATPMEIVVDAPDVKSAEVQAGINSLVSRLGSDPMFGPASVEVNDAGDLALVSASINGDYAGSAATDAIQRVRHDYVASSFSGLDAKVYVSGESAVITDILIMLSDYTPIVLGVVLFLSFILLLVMFRSIVVPLSAIAMNLLSVGAAYGLLVLVFQHGFLHQIFGFEKLDVIVFWLPLLLFAILFGLSMDYHVFLLSRIRERFDETGDNREAVSFGVRHTGRIITGAALIMVTVFGAFATGRLSPLQQIGFGLAVAVIIDATLIRTVLVPATMTLLGRWNWYLPRWLNWLPNFRAGSSERQLERSSSK